MGQSADPSSPCAVWASSACSIAIQSWLYCPDTTIKIILAIDQEVNKTMPGAKEIDGSPEEE